MRCVSSIARSRPQSLTKRAESSATTTIGTLTGLAHRAGAHATVTNATTTVAGTPRIAMSSATGCHSTVALLRSLLSVS